VLAQAKCFSNSIKTTGQQEDALQPKEQFMQFSKEPIMSNFGELPFGHIPEPLRHVRPMHETQLSNGIRVCTEKSDGQLAYIGVYVGSGSRNEDLSTTGTAYLLQKMTQKGTSSRSKTELSEDIENMGGRYSAHSDREFTRFGMQCFNNDAGRAVSLLGDMICNSTLNSAELELVKEEVSQEHEDNHHRYSETTIENAHFNAYREHMMGQPIKGDRDLTHTLGVDHLRDFHTANYYGDNITVVATGNVSHEQVCDAVQQHFSSLPKSTNVPKKNTEKPIYIPALLFIRDDEMVNSNVGIFYDAPGVKDEDYFAFKMLKNMFGRYRIDEHAEHLNDVHKQYNSMHALLGNLPDVTRADSHYFAYSDGGLFGNYFFGNEVFTRQMNYCGVCLPTIYSHYLNDVEVIRGRNYMYNELLRKESAESINHEIGTQMTQLGRRMPRAEVAKRVASIDNYHLKNVCNQWFYDAEPSFTNWGPIETVSQVGSYKYFKINTMATVTNAHHSLFN
jgi:processing peptidase subunit beta